MKSINGIKPLKLKNVVLKNNLFLAPLAGFTDIAMRKLCRDYGAALTTTEMVSCKGLIYNNQNTKRLLQVADNETPSCVQLFGSEKENFETVLKRDDLKNFDIIDINMGCPMPKITKNGDGSALMKNPKLAAKVVEGAVSASNGRPVTVKIRIGWDAESINAVTFAKTLENAGASMVTVHGRTSTQMYHGDADWDIIGDVAANLKIPVIGNGDVKTITSAQYYLKTYPVSGLMIGRGAVGHPDFFSELLGGDGAVLHEVMLKHIDYMQQYFDEHYIVTNFRKHSVHYLKGVPNTKNLRQQLTTAETVEQIKTAIKLALPLYPTD